MKAPALPRSINNQFRKAMKRRRQRRFSLDLTAARRLKQRPADPPQLPETPQPFRDFFARWYRRVQP